MPINTHPTNKNAILAALLALPCLSSCAAEAGDAGHDPPPATRQQAEGVGKDGALTVADPDTKLNRYAVLGADANPGNTVLTLSTTAGLGVDALLPLAPGDLLLIIQIQGAELSPTNSPAFGDVIDLGSAGLYEFVEVATVDAANSRITINTGCSGLKNGYQTSGHVQVIRVPQYTTLTVANAGSVTAKPWDGRTGGVIAVQVAGTAQIEGKLDASAAGFRGGERNPVVVNRLPNVGSFYLSMNALDGSNRGEGLGGFKGDYASLGQYGRGAAANGGGGGNRIGAGGGGGGNGGSAADWSGQGVMAASAVGAALAWPLDPGYQASQARAAGGGRGGYSVSDGQQDPTAVAPGDASWGQDLRRERGGLGGRPVPSDAKSRIYLGGGGGGGDDYMGTSGNGGRGGGLIFIDAGSISGGGQLLANGQVGADSIATSSGGGGGGAGGTIVLSADTVEGVSAVAQGGGGGGQAQAATMAGGPGGGGGGGFIVGPTGTAITRQVNGGAGGTTQSTDMVKFPRNGATDGAIGTVVDQPSAPFAGAPFCSVADLSIAVAAQPAQVSGIDPFVLTVTASNSGPSRTGSVTVPLDLPSGVKLVKLDEMGWDCVVTAQHLSCTLADIGPNMVASFALTLIPALATDTMTFQISASSPSTDPNPGNNQATVTVTNAGPYEAHLAGGGVGCTATGASASRSGSGGALLLAMLALGLRRRRRFEPEPGGVKIV